MKIEAVLPELKQKIMELKPSLTGAKDQYAWLGHPFGLYSAKSDYYTTKECASPEIVINPPEFNWNSEIWNTNISQKLNPLLVADLIYTLQIAGILTTNRSDHHALLLWILWALWIARNNKMFSDRAFTEKETIVKAIHNAKEWIEAQGSPHEESIPQEEQRSILPKYGLRCFSDAT